MVLRGSTRQAVGLQLAADSFNPPKFQIPEIFAALD
jgi:hypothetical protein